MSFFDVPAPPPEPARPHEREQPEWVGPPQGVLPGASTQRAVLFRTDRAFLMAHRFLAYPNGIEFTFNLRLRNPDDYQHDLPWELHRLRRSGPPPDDLLRLGMLLSDGSKWTNLSSEWRPRRPDEQPEQLVVMGRGGGGGGDSYNSGYWMWPLPPAGPLTVDSEWPAYDVPETRVVVDATELRARAAEAEPIWPE